MANITPQMVKDLRARTGAGMADCKKALSENDADMDAAIEYLRKKGAASAAKRADRETNEGLIVTKTNSDNTKAVLVEVTCETDFVAKNQDYVDYVETVANALMNNDVENVESLLTQEVNGNTVQDLHNDILAKFNEKIEIGRISNISSNGYIEGYIHSGSKLAVLVDVSISNINDDAKALIKDIAMQIAAMAPIAVDRDGVDQSVLDKEKEIYVEQAVQEGKAPEIATRVAEGRVNKFYKENCLLEQVFVKDSKKTIKDVVKDLSTMTGSDVKINNFTRIAIGS